MKTISKHSTSQAPTPPDVSEMNANIVPKGPRYSVKSPSRGGARPGAGRKKGQSPRYTLEQLLSNLEKHTGISYAEQVAINYANAISRSDWSGVRDYDRILLGKAVADKLEVETTESEDATVAKAQAFAEALSNLTTVNKDKNRAS